jgi:predicted amidohydrolase
MRVGVLQLSSTDDPQENLVQTLGMVAQAVAGGAQFIATPEVTNIISGSRTHQRSVLCDQADDPTLAGLRDAAQRHGVWVLIGSLALLSDDPDGRFINRSFLITPNGDIAASYDKIHMFDVTLSETESYRESDGYRPGNRAVLAKTDIATIGMSVCYDLRFPYLYRSLAQAGAQILTIPAAFAQTTGQAHWEILLRARAIETGCFVIAPAQCGDHAVRRGPQRKTYGHSMIIAPWGDIIAQAGTEKCVIFAEIDLGDVDKARARVPSLVKTQEILGP